MEEDEEDPRLHCHLGQASYRHFQHLCERLNSFSCYPQPSTLPLERFAEAGFYFNGYALVCFYCSLTLYKWNEEWDPFTIHAILFPHCLYLMISTSWKFIEDIKNDRALRHHYARFYFSQSGDEQAEDVSLQSPLFNARYSPYLEDLLSQMNFYSMSKWLTHDVTLTGEWIEKDQDAGELSGSLNQIIQKEDSSDNCYQLDELFPLIEEILHDEPRTHNPLSINFNRDQDEELVNNDTLHNWQPSQEQYWNGFLGMFQRIFSCFRNVCPHQEAPYQ